MSFNRKQLKTFSTQPGVYIMKDIEGSVLYVGKAKNLRSRVQNYFSSGGDSRLQIPLLLRAIATIETIVVSSEKEAFLLEDTLIKKYKPKYNIVLKDDKTHICLQITKHAWPMVRLVRRKGVDQNDGWTFGPYTSAYAARRVLDAIHKAFPLRQCSDSELLRRTRPCILYEMKQCVAPCVGLCTPEEYENLVKKSKRFLSGGDRTLIKHLKSSMDQAVQQLEFEQAQEYLEQIRAIEKITQKQRVVRLGQGDQDILGLFRKDTDILLYQMVVREGILVGTEHYSFRTVAQSDHEVLSSFIRQHYRGATILPQQIQLPFVLEESALLEEWFLQNREHKVRLCCPKMGENKALVAMAQKNAEAEFVRRGEESIQRERLLLELKERLDLGNYPRRIECFDISNIAGSDPVAAMVTFIDGKPDKTGYRTYKLEDAVGGDDYGSMYEVLVRRLRRAKDSCHLPDLLLIDGGIGHLQVGVRAMRDEDISSIDIVSCAKDTGRHDRGLAPERLFLPESKEPLCLPSTSAVLLLLQQIRDEAHRVALAFHRKRRGKRVIKSQLDAIPGIGPKRKRALLRHFHSVDKIFAASLEELCSVPTITKSLAQSIIEWKERNSTSS